jgi:hypothetical protein
VKEGLGVEPKQNMATGFRQLATGKKKQRAKSKELREKGFPVAYGL